MIHTLRLILGDQLDPHHPWFQRVDSEVAYVMIEAQSEQAYVRHHVQKVALFFASMRAFSAERAAEGHQMIYRRITECIPSFEEGLRQILQQTAARRIELQQPDEWRLDAQFARLSECLGVPVEIVPTHHFMTERAEAGRFFAGARHWLMERFYRHMRVRHQVLMGEGGKPIGGPWNFDAQNRSPATQAPEHYPAPPNFGNDFEQVLRDIDTAGLDVFGRRTVATHYPITRQQALQLLQHFIETVLPRFGETQDVMLSQQPYLHHSLLSFALNVKLLNPREVIAAAEEAYHLGRAPIAATEGFIRQIQGWREYMRGVYWAHMPDYPTTNFFQAARPLPSYYWTGTTRMACISHAVADSLDHAYAHHIQRLMVTGNFATLIGVAPAEINAWYLGIYADALEWVQLPNTHGMSQWADGGLVATKPYVSGGAYLKRMSNYCRGCYYDVNQRTGPRACPFNSLYWHFLHRHEDKLATNPRLAQPYATWRKMSAEARSETLAQAETYLAGVEQL